MARPMLAGRRLVVVVEGFALPARPIRRVFPQARMLAPKIRAFPDFAAQRLRGSRAASPP
jgi:DNA-binding transcriptional LysR family regulator